MICSFAILSFCSGKSSNLFMKIPLSVQDNYLICSGKNHLYFHENPMICKGEYLTSSAKLPNLIRKFELPSRSR